MTAPETHISGSQKIASLVVAVTAGGFAFSWTFDFALRGPAYYEPHIFNNAMIAMGAGILPAAIVGTRLLRRAKLDVYRFALAGAAAAFIPMLVSIASVLGIVVAPFILVGGVAGGLTAWSYLALTGQIPVFSN